MSMQPPYTKQPYPGGRVNPVAGNGRESTVLDPKRYTRADLESMSMADLITLQEYCKRTADIITSIMSDKAQAAVAAVQQNAQREIERIAAAAGLDVKKLRKQLKAEAGPKKIERAAGMYVNPDNGSQTWVGRGRKPTWLQARLDAGAKLEDFRAP